MRSAFLAPTKDFELHIRQRPIEIMNVTQHVSTELCIFLAVPLHIAAEEAP